MACRDTFEPTPYSGRSLRGAQVRVRAAGLRHREAAARRPLRGRFQLQNTPAAERTGLRRRGAALRPGAAAGCRSLRDRFYRQAFLPRPTVYGPHGPDGPTLTRGHARSQADRPATQWSSPPPGNSCIPAVTDSCRSSRCIAGSSPCSSRRSAENPCRSDRRARVHSF